MNRTSTSSVTPPPRLRLYTPTQLALAPGPPFLFLGKRTVGAWGGAVSATDRKHLSFVPPDQTRKEELYATLYTLV
jgi:hypothetical protein